MNHLIRLPIKKHVLPIALCFLGSFAGFSQTNSLSEVPAVWLKADAGRGNTLLWEDQSGHQMDAISSTNAWPNMDTTINFNPAFYFEGIKYNISTSFNLDPSTENVVMAVYHPYDTLDRGLWGTENTLTKLAMLSTHRALGPDSIVDVYESRDTRPVLNTLVQNWTEEPDAILSESASVGIGSAGVGRELDQFKGAFAELIIFDQKPTFMQKVQYQTYLSIKYGTTLQQSNYASSAEQVLWDEERDGDYGNRIFGVGRDDVFGLYQKQSKNAQDTSSLLLLSAGAVAIDNSANQAKINDRDFILIGDNNATLQTKENEDKYNPLALLQRKWLVKATGNTINQLDTEIRIDLSQFPQDSSGYWMVIDRSGNNDFSVNNLEYKEADEITEAGIATFKNLLWDPDFSGSDMFGFARIEDFLVAVQTTNDPTCADRTGGEVLVNVVNGEGPFDFIMTHTSNEIQRAWRGDDKEEQYDLTPGEYMLTATAADGQVQERPFVLTLADGPLIDLGEDQEIVGQISIELDASTLVPDSITALYEWKSNYGFYSTDSAVSITESGIYTATVEDQKTGCYYSDNIVISGTDRWKYLLYPTLSEDGVFNVNISLIEPGNVSVEIYDMSGNLYYEVKGEGQSEYLFGGKIKGAGTYVMYLRTPDGVKSQKLIVY